MKKIITASFILLIGFFGDGVAEKLLDFVNPLIGSDSSYRLSNGNTYPAVALPSGMTSWTPQTAQERWIYTYMADSIQGIRATHQPSPWISDYGSFTIMPMTENIVTNEKLRASSFNHQKEICKPHYYKVYLNRYNVTAEITPTMRCAFMKFSFQDAQTPIILVDLHPSGCQIKIYPEQRKIVGFTRSNHGGVPENFACYFVAKFDTPFDSYGTSENGNLFYLSEQQEGERVYAFVKFANNRQKIINLKLGTSFISIEQAERNLKQEIGIMNFETLKDVGADVWENELEKIQIEGATTAQKTTFYSAFYRCLLFPRVWYERDKDDRSIYFSPYDGKIHLGVMYSDTGFWDTYRALFPFYTILYPDKLTEIIRGLLNAYDEGGWLPKWMSPGYRDSMIGTHTAAVIADAYLKNITDFDVEKAYKAMWKDATEKSTVAGGGRRGIEYYKKLGFVPTDNVKEATSRTLEFSYDDYCVAQLAKALGKTDDFSEMMNRSLSYKMLFDSASGFMRGKEENGAWQIPFDPISWGGAYTEGNAWHYTWSVQHDARGLINLYGGRDKFCKKLDGLFATSPHFKVGSYGRVIHEMIEMVRANMGQYAHGNEPVHHVAYLYNYGGQPWKTQKWVRRILNELYGPGPAGFCGDEDNGQMSAWYIFSALGFYPFCPGQPFYTIGSPLYEKVTLKLPNGKKFIISAINNSARNPYIQSIKINGKEYSKTWLSHETICKGGILKLEMADSANLEFGTRIEDSPQSFYNE